MSFAVGNVAKAKQQLDVSLKEGRKGVSNEAARIRAILKRKS